MKKTKKFGVAALTIASALSLGTVAVVSAPTASTYQTETYTTPETYTNSTGTETVSVNAIKYISDYGVLSQAYFEEDLAYLQNMKFVLPSSVVDSTSTLTTNMAVRITTTNSSAFEYSIGLDNLSTTAANSSVESDVILEQKVGTDSTYYEFTYVDQAQDLYFNGLTANTEYTIQIYFSSTPFGATPDLETKTDELLHTTIKFTTPAAGETMTEAHNHNSGEITNVNLSSDYDLAVRYTLSSAFNVENLPTNNEMLRTQLSMTINGQLPENIVDSSDTDYTIKMSIDGNAYHTDWEPTATTTDITGMEILVPMTSFAGDQVVTVSTQTFEDGAFRIQDENGDWTAWSTEGQEISSNATAAAHDAISNLGLKNNQNYEITFSVTAEDNSTDVTTVADADWTEWFTFSFKTSANYEFGQVSLSGNQIASGLEPANISDIAVNDSVEDATWYYVGVGAIVLASVFFATTMGLGYYIWHKSHISSKKSKK